MIGAAVGIYVPKVLDPPDTRPIAVNVVSNPATVDTWGSDEFGLVMPKDAKPAGQPPIGCSEIVDWARHNGAVDRDVSRVRLVVQGVTDQGVLIDNLRAKVIRHTRTPEPAGVELRCGGAQGVATPRRVVIDLDAEEPAAAYAEEIAGRIPLFGFTLQKGETEIFDLTATTKGTVEWVLELDLVVGGERQTVEVTNRGASFMTTAWRSSRTYQVPAGTDYWVECSASVGTECKENVSPVDFRYSS
ncbi:hypothetical protein C1I99_04285 [Micromonospora deserti]|uniref:Uncharacterized protein n=1 Tax=Micromonospora deserti TaxID=2070366 RepID=A0A2W2DMD4_9ACTN|nr:hypothetical protein C1I99_04285 [Micromonospora deserti]